ncbi:hypothetical protein J6590_024344 [Homalodisca vitripennis]|nr:hypothetical protein J6590_024344 [Homalodisca vitripennis]
MNDHSRMRSNAKSSDGPTSRGARESFPVERFTSINTFRESSRDAFRSLGLQTLPCLYILEVALYCRYKCELTHGSDVHGYNTRGKDNLRIQSNRKMAYEQLPSQELVAFERFRPLPTPSFWESLTVTRRFLPLVEAVVCCNS